MAIRQELAIRRPNRTCLRLGRGLNKFSNRTAAASPKTCGAGSNRPSDSQLSALPTAPFRYL
jgi:hypothetical protein